jgi:hypothetical protein
VPVLFRSHIYTQTAEQQRSLAEETAQASVEPNTRRLFPTGTP